MADNLPVDGGTAYNVATDEIGGVHHQRQKIQFGADGSATDVSSSDPLPVIPTDSGGSEIVPATAANQATANAALSAIQTATETIDNAIGTHDSAPPSGIAVAGAVYDPYPSDVASGDAVKLRGTARGALNAAGDGYVDYSIISNELRNTSIKQNATNIPAGYRVGYMYINNTLDAALSLWIGIAHGSSAQAFYSQSGVISAGGKVMVIPASSAGAGSTNICIPALQHLSGFNLYIDFTATTTPTTGSVTVDINWVTI